MLKLTDRQGDPIFINPALIGAVESGTSGSRITLDGGEQFEVGETAETVVGAIDAARKDSLMVACRGGDPLKFVEPEGETFEEKK